LGIKEIPILFNTLMVQAILENRKVNTRRIINPKNNDGIRASMIYKSGLKDSDGHEVKKPYQIGDTLWVRETYLKADDSYHYKADETKASKEIRESYGYKWKPSIHMPRIAARVFLKVTAVKMQRIKDITEPEALKEGFISTAVSNLEGDDYTGLYAYEHFINVWDDIYAKQGNGWDFNPWVWVIEFEKI
jgi:hypothetical protein